MNITYREYTDADKALLLTLTKKLDAYAKSLDPLNRLENQPGFAELCVEETLSNVEKYQGKIIFVEDDGTAVGYSTGVIWKQSEKNRLEIGTHLVGEVLDLYVDEEYRGKGIGKTLLQMMSDHFKSHGCDGMRLSLFAPNENAHMMYKNFGFVDRDISMFKEI